MNRRYHLPVRILSAVRNGFRKYLGNERGEVAIPFIETVPEAQRESVTAFVTNSGATTEDLKGYGSFNDYLGGYKPKAPTGDWKANLPTEIAKDPVFEKYEHSNDAHKALVAAQKFLGRETLPVPKDDKDVDALNIIFKKLGLPENAEAYVIPTDLDIPKDFPMDEQMIKGFREEAHKLGILPSQFAGLYRFYMNYGMAQHKSMGEQSENFYKDSENALRKKWGAAYGQNVELAKKVFSQFAGEDAIVEFQSKFGNNPILIEMFANMGKVLSEDQLVGKGSGLTQTPEEAQLEIKKMEAEKDSPLFNQSHPQHQEYVEKRYRLQKLMTG